MNPKLMGALTGLILLTVYAVAWDEAARRGREGEDGRNAANRARVESVVRPLRDGTPE
jgi:hypothetical protein